MSSRLVFALVLVLRCGSLILMLDECHMFCNRKDIRDDNTLTCSPALRTACAKVVDKLDKKPTGYNSTKTNMQFCACHLPKEVYDKYYANLKSTLTKNGMSGVANPIPNTSHAHRVHDDGCDQPNPEHIACNKGSG